MWKNKRIFVTGGTGVIGSSLVQYLFKQGAILFVGDLKPRPMSWHKNILYRQGDLNEISLEEVSMFKPEYIFHLAATFERAQESYTFSEENFRHNITLSHHMLALAKKLPTLKRFVFASSYLIYDPKLYSSNSTPSDSYRLDELDRIYPRNTCGAAKLQTEIDFQYLKNFKQTPFTSIHARIFRVYGKGSKDVISRWIRALIKNESITVYHTENRFDFIFAEDVAIGLVHLAEINEEGIVNLGTDTSHSIHDVISILKNYFPNMKTNQTLVDEKFESSQANMEKFKKIINWYPSKKIEDGIKEIIEFEKTHVEKERIEINNILVTDISKKVSQIKHIINAKNRIGYYSKVIGIDAANNVIGKFFVDEFYQVPKLSNTSVEDFINFCKEHNVKCVIPTSDGALKFFAENKNYFLENKINVMISDFESIQSCLDKMYLFEKLQKIGYSAIPTSKNIDSLDAESYVVKEQIADFGVQRASINSSKDKAVLFSSSLKNPIFQNYITGDEYSVDIYIDKKTNVKGVVTRTRENIQNGESQITRSFRDENLETFCSILAKQLGFYGHIVMQVIVDSSKNIHVVECNNRFGGASSLSLEVGLDTFYWFLRESLGETLESYTFNRSIQEKKQIRFPTDLII